MEQPVDPGAGSRGFSYDVVAYLMQHAPVETHALATDSEWPVLLHRAGFCVKPHIAEESFYEVSSDDHHQRLHSVQQWQKRVRVAQIIVQAALDAARYPVQPAD